MNLLAVVGPSAPDRLTALEYYRVVDPLKALTKRGHKARIAYGGRITQDDLAFADVVYFCGTGFDTFEQFGWFRKLAKGKSIVVDLNDHHWAEGGRATDHDRRVHEVMLTGADFVTTTTGALNGVATARSGGRFCPKMTIHNAEDPTRWQIPEGTQRPPGLTIGWWGGITHQSEMRLLSGVLRRTARRFPEVSLVVAGDLELPDELRKLDERVRLYRVPGVPFGQFPAVVNCVDIVLAPMATTAFNECRSWVRWLQAAMLGRPVIASPMVYRDVITPGYSGFVADTPEEWDEAIAFLVQNPKEREIFGENARTIAMALHTIDRRAEKWEAAFETAAKAGGKA